MRSPGEAPRRSGEDSRRGRRRTGALGRGDSPSARAAGHLPGCVGSAYGSVTTAMARAERRSSFPCIGSDYRCVTTAARTWGSARLTRRASALIVNRAPSTARCTTRSVAEGQNDAVLGIPHRPTGTSAKPDASTQAQRITRRCADLGFRYRLTTRNGNSSVADLSAFQA